MVAAMREIKGKKIGKDGMYPEMAERKGDVVYPTFYISIEHLPEAKAWKIGSTYDVTLRVKQTGVNIRRNEGRKTDYGEANFEIVGIAPCGEVKTAAKRYSRIKK